MNRLPADAVIVTRDAVEVRGRNPRLCVIGRDLCAFHPAPGLSVREGAIGKVARLEALRVSPFETPGVYAHVEAGDGAVWTWDEDALRKRLDASDAPDPDALRFVPEPALTPRPDLSLASDADPFTSAADGAARLRLIQCLNGYEGQAWRGGVLGASRWWPEAPARRDWALFARAAGAPADADPPAAETPEFLRRPWARNIATDQGGDMAPARRIAQFAAIASAALIAFAVGDFARASAAKAGAESRAAEAAEAAAPVADAIAAMRQAGAAERRERARFAQADAVDAFGAVAAALAGRNERVVAMAFNEDRLELTLENATMLRSAQLVRAFEQQPMFAEVSASTARNPRELRLEMLIREAGS